jgi:glutathione synthase/RimK-type ligase-like ATP-grasp enzyme
MSAHSLNAVLFVSARRFEAFRDRLAERGVVTTVLDFDNDDWITYDYSHTDILIYFPAFKFSSNHPQALYEVHDNLAFIHAQYPMIRMFPDPRLIRYYADKYRQMLFLRHNAIPHPETLALTDTRSLDRAERNLGYPMVLKNRFGAGGDFVFIVNNRRQLEKYFRLSVLDLANVDTVGHYLRLLTSRMFYYHLLKERRMAYPFISPPLLAQKFIPHDVDLKTVVSNGKVVEAHWRRKADERAWKMNIDGGGIGEWSFVPDEPIALSERVGKALNATWINLDLIQDNRQYLVTEFSPVWHHYRYHEKPSFVYKDDYNLPVPLDRALDLETLIVDSLVYSASRT